MKQWRQMRFGLVGVGVFLLAVAVEYAPAPVVPLVALGYLGGALAGVGLWLVIVWPIAKEGPEETTIE